jgi:hypothetical protein
VDNLIAISQLQHKISFNMLHFLLNYRSIFDCIDYLKSLEFHNNSFVAGPLLTPVHLNIRNLPTEAITQVSDILKARINEQPGYLLEDSYKNMLSYLAQPFEKDLADSFVKIQAMDQRRGLDSRKIFQELYQYE